MWWQPHPRGSGWEERSTFQSSRHSQTRSGFLKQGRPCGQECPLASIPIYLPLWSTHLVCHLNTPSGLSSHLATMENPRASNNTSPSILPQDEPPASRGDVPGVATQMIDKTHSLLGELTFSHQQTIQPIVPPSNSCRSWLCLPLPIQGCIAPGEPTPIWWGCLLPSE